MTFEKELLLLASLLCPLYKGFHPPVSSVVSSLCEKLKKVLGFLNQSGPFCLIQPVRLMIQFLTVGFSEIFFVLDDSNIFPLTLTTVWLIWRFWQVLARLGKSRNAKWPQFHVI